MPAAARRPCPSCLKRLVTSGVCDECHSLQAPTDPRRSARARGYDRQWEIFREMVFSRLLRIGLETNGPGPCCGARLPEAPVSTDSACAAQGILTTRGLHLDHFPPLTLAEREDARAVCDPSRVQLLCHSCHNAKTNRERTSLAFRASIESRRRLAQ